MEKSASCERYWEKVTEALLVIAIVLKLLGSVKRYFGNLFIIAHWIFQVVNIQFKLLDLFLISMMNYYKKVLVIFYIISA